MDYILRKFKYKQKPRTTPKMVITSPKSLEEESSDSTKFDFDFEEHTPNTPNKYSNPFVLKSNQTQQTDRNSGVKHKCVINSNHIRHHSHHTSQCSLNSSPSRSSDSSDVLEHKQFDSTSITKVCIEKVSLSRT